MNEKPEVPLNLNWIKARHDCSLVQVFATLRLEIESDVDAINALIKPGLMFRFRVANGGNRFSVICDVNGDSGDAVDFGIVNDEILVAENNAEKFRASLTLTNNGSCKLQVKGEELEHWQFRRMALEKLFFNGHQGRYL